MEFLKNAWYCAAWAHEVMRTPLVRTLLNIPVVLFRKEDGSGIVALSDVCPHRFAPLHSGKLHGDALACPYHGLQFGETGACVFNPHGEIIPPALKVPAYPVVERHALAWIWMGDPALADASRIPEFPAHDDPGFVIVGGRIPVRGSYQLVSDNLLDLSHTQYLHPILTLPDDPDVCTVNDIISQGDTITTVFNQLNTKPFGFVSFVWPDGPQRLDSFSGIRWQAPANMLLKVHFVSRDPGRTDEILMLGAELVTPETDTTCHYFWSSARNFRRDDAAFSEMMRQAISGVFTNEDGAMIETVQTNMGDQTDLIALRPVILPTDRAAIQARMTLKRLMADEKRQRAPAEMAHA
jgi:vanillate O-demethylase monooxygenase subunit